MERQFLSHLVRLQHPLQTTWQVGRVQEGEETRSVHVVCIKERTETETAHKLWECELPEAMEGGNHMTSSPVLTGSAPLRGLLHMVLLRPPQSPTQSDSPGDCGSHLE